MVTRFKKVLITGIDGFTGRYLRELLSAEGYDVYGIALDCRDDDKSYACDITNKDEVMSVLLRIVPDYVVHLAAKSFVLYGDTPQFYHVNVFGTLNILDALLECDINPDKIIIPSSGNVYGNVDFDIIDENVCPGPTNHYANSKIAMEYMVKTFFSRLNIIITRPFNYTGTGQSGHFLIPKIVKHFIDREKDIEMGNCDVIKDFSDIRFVVQVYKKLMECNVKSEVINISSGKGVSVLDIINIMNRLAGYQINVKKNPKFVRENEIKRLIGSNRKLFSIIDCENNYKIEDILKFMYKKNDLDG